MLCCVITPSVAAYLFLKVSDFTSDALSQHMSIKVLNLMNIVRFSALNSNIQTLSYTSSVQCLHYLLPRNRTVFVPLGISFISVSEAVEGGTFSKLRNVKSCLPA